MKSIGDGDVLVPNCTPGRKSMTDVEDLYDNPSRSSFSRASMNSIDLGDILGSQPPQHRMQRRNTTMQIPIDIGHTQAAELDFGEEVQVSSESSNRVFDFDKASAPTVLCMSIWKEMTLNIMDGESRGSPRRVTADKAPMNHPSQPLNEDAEIDFQLDTCLVDFTSPIDTIVVPCGHRCFNAANLNRTITHCPLCRTPISAIIPVGIVLEF